MRFSRRIFAALTVFLVLLATEIGAFVLLSAALGELATFSDVWRLQETRRSAEPVDMPARPMDLREYRITWVPALHPYLGEVIDPLKHPAAGSPEISPQAMDYGFLLNRHDLLRPVADDEVVIAILGGSFAAGFTTSLLFDDTPIRGLERFAGRKPVILSLAAGGYKQPQQVMTLNYFLALGAHFDVVINLDGFNEIALPPVNLTPKGIFPFYPRSWVPMVGDLDQEMRRAAGELTYLRRRRAEQAELFLAPPWRYSMTSALVWYLLDRGLGARISAAEQNVLSEERSPSWQFQARGPRRDYASDDEMYDDLVAMWKRSSLILHDLCSARGIAYFHFLQPNQYVMGAKPLSAEEREQAWDDEHPYRGPVEVAYPRLRAAGRELRQAGVAFDDLTEIFSGVEETLYKDKCCHVNERGLRLVAGRVARTIAEGPPGS